MVFASLRSPVDVRRTSGALYDWWRRTGSNRRPTACKAVALPTELHPPNESGAGNRDRTCDARIFGPPLYLLSYPGKKIGAGNEDRTRGLDLGKVALYLLSYARVYRTTIFLL